MLTTHGTDTTTTAEVEYVTVIPTIGTVQAAIAITTTIITTGIDIDNNKF